MPVQVSPDAKRANSVGVSTSTMHYTSQSAYLDGSHKLESFEKTQLEEVLDMCADYERQIEAEQKEALRLRQKDNLANVNQEWNNNINNKKGDATITNAGVSPEQINALSKLNPSKIGTIYENGGSHTSGSLHPVTPTSPNGNSCSPGGTMITPSRIITNGSLPRDKRQTSPSPSNTPILPRFASSFGNGNIQLGATISTFNKVGFGKSTTTTEPGQPPSSPFLPASESDLKSIFGFDSKKVTEMFSPDNGANVYENGMSQSKLENVKLQSSSATPTRNTIRTSPNAHKIQQNGQSSNDNNYANIFNFTEDYNFQGGGEDIYSNGITSSMSNKNLSGHFSLGFANSDSSSPGSTAPRRPPRSKHDLALSPANGCSPVSPCMERKQLQNDEAHKAQINHVMLPSKEAPSRLLIGTQMLQGTQNNKHVAATTTSYQSQTALKNNQNLGYFEPEKGNASWVIGSTTPQEGIQNHQRSHADSLNSQRKNQLTIVSTLKQRLLDLEQREVEEIGELDFERSLIIGELDSENEQLRKIRSRLSLLRIQEQRLSGVFEEWQKVAALKIDEVEERILNAEDELRRLQKAYQHSKNSDEILADEIAGSNDDTLRSDELLERIKYQQELVDLERKTFEDMEFHQMEEEAHKQTEREELLKEICELEKEVKKHETQLSELEEQQKKILENVRKDTNTLEKQRQRVIKELEKEKMRLCEIESKLNKLSRIPSSSDDTDDFVSHYSNLQDYSNSLLNDSYHQKAPNGFNGISHQGLSSPSTYSFSDDDDFTPFGENIIDGHPSSNETNHELEQSLKRLALLDKTQEEIEKISKAVIKLKMSSKLVDNSLPDSQYCIDKFVPASAPLDNQLLSFNKEYEKHQNLVTNDEYSIVKNRNVCDNTIQLNNLRESSQEDNSILDKNTVLTPRNCRKFSPEKIKGSPLLVLQQQKKVAEELNRVIKAMNNGNDNVSSLEKTETFPSDVSPITEKLTATPSQNMQVSTKNLMINSLNSAGSDMEDSVTGDSTSDLHTESLSSDDCPQTINNEGKRIISNTNGLTQSDNGSLITNKSSSQNGYLSTDSGHINSEMLNGKTSPIKEDGHQNMNTLSECDVQSVSSREIGGGISGNNPEHLHALESRPISEASSVWDEVESRNEVKRRQQQFQHKHQRPLTRYLPIRSEQLDLRAHIETAGHQLELASPSVVIDSLTCRGYLHKLGSAASSSTGRRTGFSGTGANRGKFGVSTLGIGQAAWKKRWFVFDRSKKTLIYYGDKNESKAKGGVYFRAIEEVYVDHMNSVGSPNPKLTFAMKTFERTYYLMAPSPEAMRIWVDVIFTGAEGYQEFMPC